MEGAQRQAPGHGDVLQGIGEESEATVGGIYKEEDSSGLLGLWETIGDGVRVQTTLPWAGAHNIR